MSSRLCGRSIKPVPVIAPRALDELAAFGLRCPEDMSVAGFNDMPFLTRMSPPRTAVHVPQQEVGAEAARMLLKCIDQPGPPRSLMLGCALVVRASTGPVPQG
jgi:LacI family transcriptional regulator